MNIQRQLVAFAMASALVASAWAQSTQPRLNLKLPPGVTLPTGNSTAGKAAPAPASSAVLTGSVPSLATAAPTSAATTQRPAPGVYYGDTSGAMGNTETANVPTCDDSTFNDPQVHGEVSTGIFTGSHVGTGNYQSGTINVSKRTGDCEHPGVGFNMSISVGQSHLNGGGRRGGW